MYKRDKLLGQYIQDYYFERHQQHFYVKPYGFICYRFEDDTVIIDEIYIKREFRRNGGCAAFANQFLELAKRAGCNHLIGFVDTSIPNGYHVESLFKDYGMTQDLEHSQPNYLKYTKDI